MNVTFDGFISQQFGTVILQPTTLCPWECEYCYLTTKEQRLEMSPEIATAVAESVQLQDAAVPVDVVWHGGEPLAIGYEKLRRLLECFEPLRQKKMIRHGIQTNAGLVTSEWCDLFAHYDVAIGVSIDGPEWANSLRHDRSGRPAFHRIMKGIETLKSCGISFNIIAVVTKESIGRADEIIEFLDGLDPLSVGFNLEEQEGANTGRAVIDRAAATEFWRAVYKYRAANPSLRIREVDHVLNYLRHARDTGMHPAQSLIDPIPTVAWNGDTVILSPELAGVKDPAYGDFVIGNVQKVSLPAMLATAPEIKYVAEFVTALTSCATGCDFYDFCRGSQAGNRYFGYGTFTISETTHCINTRQSLVHALGELIAERGEL
jgi:uncharacterized protein